MSACAYRWAKVLQALEQRLSPAVVREYFRDVEPIRLDERELVLYSPSYRYRQHILCRCAPHIRSVLKDLYGLEPDISFQGTCDFPAILPREILSRGSLCSDYTLDNFIPGQHNRTALALARQTAENPGQNRHNPLVFYGPTGSGKTYLLHAIGGEIRKRHPDLRVMYLQCADFADDLITSIVHGWSIAFQNRCLDNDVLLVDDVQFLAGKETVQQEFYLIFSLLYERGCQIILSCDRPLGQVLALEDRMYACFIGGIMHPLALPGWQVRRSFLEEYARKRQLELSPEALDFLAEWVVGGFARLRNAVDHLCLQAPTLPFRPDMDAVTKAVAKFCSTCPE